MHKKILFIIFIFAIYSNYAQENKLSRFSIVDDFTEATINHITQDKIGYLWIASDNGVYKFDGIKAQNVSTKSSNYVLKNQNTIYIAHTNGLTTCYQNKKEHFNSNEVYKISVFKDNIFLATAKGICIFRKNQIVPLFFNSIINSSIVYNIVNANNQFYIATNKGLWSTDNLITPQKIKKISNLTFKQFLATKNYMVTVANNLEIFTIDKNATIQKVYELKDIHSLKQLNDEIWISTTSNGIEVINAHTFSFIRKVNKYNAKISNTLTSLFVDTTNFLWVGSNNGYIYQYDSNTSKSVVPKIHFEKVLVNYKEVNHLENKKQNLPSSENNITFSYKTVGFKNPHKTQYRYQLNKNTSPWSIQSQVTFASLQSGSYVFTAQSKSNNQLSGKISYSFTIANPFYKQTWFYILITSLFCLGLAAVIELRIKKIKKKNQQKIVQLTTQNYLMSLEQKALQLQMNPHFIFNVLNGIKALGNAGNLKELNKTITQFSILLRSILNNSRTDEITLLDEIQTLESYLALEQKMHTFHFDYSIQLNLKTIDTEEILIPPMLIQPFVENSVRHAFSNTNKKAKIEIIFEVKHQYLHITILDNGIGFRKIKEKRDKKHKSAALEITEERIQNITPNHGFHIGTILKNESVKGTKVAFKIPLKTDY